MPNHRIKILLDKLIAGSLTEQEYHELRELVKDSPENMQILEMHEKLSDTEPKISIPDSIAFEKMRSAVKEKLLYAELHGVNMNPDDLFSRIKSLIFRPEMAIAAITLILGFFLGRLSPADSENQLSTRLVKYISNFSGENTRFVDSKNSPYQYSNITMKELPGKNIEMSFDVTTHLEMVRSMDDPVVREIIAQSLLNSSNPGTELKAIAYSENIRDKKVKEALIFAMLNAPVQAVRQNAMNNLVKYDIDEDIIDAFGRVLSEEKSVKMRLTALDYFEQKNVESPRISSVLSGTDLKSNPAVWLKAQKYISLDPQKGDTNE